jgi:hypothetical protein
MSWCPAQSTFVSLMVRFGTCRSLSTSPADPALDRWSPAVPRKKQKCGNILALPGLLSLPAALARGPSTSARTWYSWLLPTTPVQLLIAELFAGMDAVVGAEEEGAVDVGEDAWCVMCGDGSFQSEQVTPDPPPKVLSSTQHERREATRDAFLESRESQICARDGGFHRITKCRSRKSVMMSAGRPHSTSSPVSR